MKGPISLAVLAAIVGLVTGCASSPPAPSPDQERITLDEYRARLETGTPAVRPAPVVTLPAGTLLKLGVPMPKVDLSDSPLLRRSRSEHPNTQPLRLRWNTPFEGLGDAEFSLRVREPVQLDLEQFLVSQDGERWSRLGSYFSLMFGATTQVTVTDPDRQDLTLPAWAFSEMTIVPPFKSDE